MTAGDFLESVGLACEPGCGFSFGTTPNMLEAFCRRWCRRERECICACLSFPLLVIMVGLFSFLPVDGPVSPENSNLISSESVCAFTIDVGVDDMASPTVLHRLVDMWEEPRLLYGCFVISSLSCGWSGRRTRTGHECEEESTVMWVSI